MTTARAEAPAQVESPSAVARWAVANEVSLTVHLDVLQSGTHTECGGCFLDGVHERAGIQQLRYMHQSERCPKLKRVTARACVASLITSIPFASECAQHMPSLTRTQFCNAFEAG